MIEVGMVNEPIPVNIIQTHPNFNREPTLTMYGYYPISSIRYGDEDGKYIAVLVPSVPHLQFKLLKYL